MFCFVCRLDCSLTINRFKSTISVETAVYYFLPKRRSRNSQTILIFDIEFKLVNICLIEIETNYQNEWVKSNHKLSNHINKYPKWSNYSSKIIHIKEQFLVLFDVLFVWKNRFALHTKSWNKIKYIFDYLDNDVLINCSTLDHPLNSFVLLNVCTLKQWSFKYK